MRLLKALEDGWFSIVVEFTPHTAADVRKLVGFGQDLVALNERLAERRAVVPAITLTHSPGGSPSYDHQAALSILRENGWPEELEIIPHVTTKDRNSEALAALIEAFPERGVDTILALTGDLPHGQKTYEIDSLGLLELLRRVNASMLKQARNDEAFAATPQVRAGAAVSPFKYTEGSLAMQFIKAAKKIRTGAAFLVCQAGWDAERSERLIAELKEEGVPLLGNVLLVNEAAARAMRELPGCAIADAFLKRLGGEGEAEARTRAAQQLAMFRGLGYHGVDLGRPGDWKSVADIEAVIDEAWAIADWQAHRDNITFVPETAAEPRVRTSAGFSHAAHRLLMEEDSALHGVAKALLGPVNSSAEREGMLYRLFRAMEDFGKGAVYQCGHCGDCFLPENEYVCTIGQCEKGLPNVPCGDADPQGRCGNNENRICAGEKIYHRLMRHGKMEEFRKVVFPPRKPGLENSSSLLNLFYGRDHNTRPRPLAGSGLVQVAELIHASIPYSGIALRALAAEGPEGIHRPNRGLVAVTELIRTQAEEGGDYIDINIDALGAPDAQDVMRRLVTLVHREGLGVPPSVDSSDPAVLEAGLAAWHDLGDDLAPALVNSIPWNEMERYAPLLARRRERPFRVIALLVGREGPLKSTDEMVEVAEKMFDRLRQDGFEPDDIFFDTVTLGIGTDGFMDAQGGMKSSHTRESFNAIKRIRSSEKMRGVHAILGVSNWVYGAKRRRIGHLRAFIQVAMEYGLDAVISDVSKGFGLRPAAPELMGLVNMFVGLDGSDDSMDRYTETMTEAREKEWV